MSVDAWKVTLPCTRAEAEAIERSDGVDIDPPPTLMTSEEVADDPARWRLDAYLEREPDAASIAAIRALCPSARAVEPGIERLPPTDWVTLSQAGLEPVHAGRFVVHTASHPVRVGPGERAFRIDAGQAFGTGHHETTAGCLAMLDTIEREGESFRRVIDIGTGTGLLAFAALSLWPRAEATATDIDPVAIAVAGENAVANGVRVGEGKGAATLLVANGAADRAVARRGPYDLVVANILAQPLIAMAEDVEAIAAPGATIVLAGLLANQADEVEHAYADAGCAPVARAAHGAWTVLRLERE